MVSLSCALCQEVLRLTTFRFLLLLLLPTSPANQNLTEECMAKTPLDFDRTKQALQWKNGTRYPIKGTFVDQGTYPKGSTWAM